MKALSHWAKNHQQLAICLIVIFELSRIAIGFTMGVSFDARPKLLIEAWVLVLSLATLAIWFYNERFGPDSNNRYMFRIKMFSLMSATTLCLSILAGNWFQSSSFTNAFGATETHVTYKQEEKITKKEINKIKKIEKKLDEGSQNKAILYVFLFVLAVVLSYFGVVFSCVLACNEQGVLAIMLFLITLGVFTTGIYFLGRVFRKSLKPFKQMSPEERKKERRSWFKSLGIVALILLLLSLINQ